MASVDTIRFRLPVKTKITILLLALGGNFLTGFYPLVYATPLLILNIFSDIINERLKVYMDDFTPYGDEFEPALEILEKVL